MLLTCKDCGNGVSDKAASCPKCGAPIEAIGKKLNSFGNTLMLAGCAITILVIVAVVLLGAAH